MHVSNLLEHPHAKYLILFSEMEHKQTSVDIICIYLVSRLYLCKYVDFFFFFKLHSGSQNSDHRFHIQPSHLIAFTWGPRCTIVAD